MTNYFQIIPQEVIISLAKNLDQKSLCNLIMCSKEFKELCDINDIWKYHYYRTIKHKWKIKEESIHTGGYNNHQQLYLYEYKDTKVVKGKLFIKSIHNPSSPLIRSENRVIYHRNSLKFIRSLGCKPYIFPYPYGYDPVDHTIMTGCMCHQHNDIKNEGFVCAKPPDMDLDVWKNDIYKKWIAYNESKGLKNL